MRITGQQSDLISQVGNVSGTTAASSVNQENATSAAATSAATVSFSSKAQEISKAVAAVNSTPDVREDLVASLKQKIDSGTYNVSSSDIADMMLRRHAADTTN